jgi:hypothetical protein
VRAASIIRAMMESAPMMEAARTSETSVDIQLKILSYKVMQFGFMVCRRVVRHQGVILMTLVVNFSACIQRGRY